MVRSLGFAEGMLIGPSMPKYSGGSRVFDWIRAAQIIREKKPRTAEAGLEEDWSCTAGMIWENGKPVPKDETYTYLSSTWATPILMLDGDEEIKCWVLEDGDNNPHHFDEHTYWPEEAKKLIETKKHGSRKKMGGKE